MSERHSSVGIFESNSAAENAVNKLHRSGVDMKKLSIIGRDQHIDEHTVGYFNIGDRMMYWGTPSKFWGGLWELLPGAGFFSVPGLGKLLVAGPLVNAITGTIKDSAGASGLNAVGTGLYNLGIPKADIAKYETALKAGLFLAIYYGTDGEVEEAREILDNANAIETTLNDPQPSAKA